MAKEDDAQSQSNQNTQEKDSEQKTDWEKRYRDEQAALTKAQKENKELRQTFEEIQPYVNWDALQGKTPQDSSIADEGFADRKEFDAFKKEVDKKLEVTNLIQLFRTSKKYSDLVEHEDLVSAFLAQKTDPRRPLLQRLDSAAESARKYLTHIEEEVKAKLDKEQTDKEKAEKEKAAKEAETAGLEGGGKAAEEGKGEVKGQTFDQYIKERKLKVAKSQGLI